MTYTLYNQRENRFLKHPRFGVWETSNKEEAERMLELCKNYLISLKAHDLVGEVQIVEVK